MNSSLYKTVKKEIKMLFRKLKVALVATAISMAPTFAATAPSFVTDEAVFWLDATTLSQLPGQEVTTWPDVRGEGRPVASTSRGVNPKMISTSGALAGKKAVDFGNLGSNKDMAFGSALNNVMMIFFVMDIDNAKYACLIGGGNSNQRFCREKQAAYAANSGQTQSYSIWTNGEKVADPLNTATPSGYNIITYRYDSNSGFPCVGYLASDRNIDGRIGGKRLCEVIGFTRVLTDAERVAVEDYLRKKWFQESWSWADGVSVNDLLGMAQVHFDASVASSFHYDTEDPTKVVQWDDLSSNHNNFTPGTTYGTINGIHYGSVSTVASKPVFDMGAPSSGIDLTLNTRLANTHTTFMVAEVQRNGNVFWLGDDNASGHGKYAFHRGGSGQYAYSVTSSEVMIDPKNGGEVWCNSVKVSSPTGSYPDDPGALSVYTFRTVNNCGWKNLGQDRTSGGRNGGKKVAELITFEHVLPDEARTRIEDYLIEKWTPTEAYIDAMAPVHVDASSADNFNYTGANITGWKNVGLGADLYYYPQGYLNETPYSMGYGSYGMTNGVPAFLMGVGGSNIDLAFERLTNIRAVFWAMDIHRSGRAFFLGDPRMTAGQDGVYHFHRGGNGEYAYNQSNVIWKNQNVCCDGIQVANMATAKPPYGMHVYDVSSSANLTAAALSGDRWCDHRNGGRAISELLIFTNTVWGLTRVGVRRRIENKWTRRCDWAGAGDAEWGADKYRVFGADAAVPTEGAAAVGVGFTASATLSGGTLTLGDGGIFASEGTDATVSAPVAGKLGAYGPGTVTLTAAPNGIDSVSVGYGATLTLPAGTTAVAGGLSIQENGKLVIDVSALAAKQHVVITFASFALPAGGTLYDYVSLAGNAAGHVLTIGADGHSIHVNDPSVALSAEWNATTSDDVTVAANWVCRNADGTVLPNTTLPCLRTTNVTLNADCDLRAWGTPVFEDGVRIDLKGHALKVADLSDDNYRNAVVTNSNAGTTAELRVEVANGKTATNSTVSIRGNVKVSKYGLGTWRVAKTSQTYSGGTLIKEGVLANSITDARNYLLGAKFSTITVSTNGTNKGVLELNGMYAQSQNGAEYKFVVDGGVIRNTGPDVNLTYGQFSDLELTADSEFIPTANFGFFAPTTEIDLGGHTLKIAIGTNGRIFHVVNGELRNGFIDITSGGWFQTGISGNASYSKTNVADTVDFRIGSALKIYGPLSVRNYEQVYGSNNNDGTAALMVHGTFKPASHNYFYGCTMMNGSTIDLSARTTALPLTSSFSQGRKTVDFAPNANVTVSLAGRTDARTLARNKEYVVTWTTAPGSDVKFALDAQSAQGGMRLRRDAGGLRLAFGGMAIIVK